MPLTKLDLSQLSINSVIAGEVIQFNGSLWSPTALTISGGQITSGTISASFLPVATNTTLGVVQPDETTIIQSSGILSVGSISGAQITSGTVGSSHLSLATNTTLGIVKPDNTTITQSAGIISVGSIAAGQITSGTVGSSYLPLATNTTLGIVKPDNITITQSAGVLSVGSIAAGQIVSGTVGSHYLPLATNTTLGIVKPDNTTITQSAGVISVGSIAAGQITSGTISTGILPVATNSTLGILQADGVTTTISGGVISTTSSGTESTPTPVYALAMLWNTISRVPVDSDFTGAGVINSTYYAAGPDGSLLFQTPGYDVACKFDIGLTNTTGYSLTINWRMPAVDNYASASWNGTLLASWAGVATMQSGTFSIAAGQSAILELMFCNNATGSDFDPANPGAFWFIMDALTIAGVEWYAG